MSTVTVTLDRADAEAWLGYYREHRLTGWERRCRDALAVALDRDREELVERIAALLTLEDAPWDETGVTERLWCRDRAARVLAALEQEASDV